MKQLPEAYRAICTRASQRNGEYNGAVHYVVDWFDHLIVLEPSNLQERVWKFKVEYNDGIKRCASKNNFRNDI